MSNTIFAGAPTSNSIAEGQVIAAERLTVSIFADNLHVRTQLREDADAANFRVMAANSLLVLSDDNLEPLGDIVLLDCPFIDGDTLHTLARIDLRAAGAGIPLIVSTNFASLEHVFACLGLSELQILVNPSQAERLIALGQVLSHLPTQRVCELSEKDRLVLLRLTEQVSQIASRMEHLSGSGAPDVSQSKEAVAAHKSAGESPSEPPGSGSAFRFGVLPSLAQTARGASERLIRDQALPLPEPKLVRRIIRQRQLRAKFFDSDQFADPAWDMLLDLTAARAEESRVSITSLCIASGVPPTTALRWIGQMTEAGLLQRKEDGADRRRAFIALTEKASNAMARFFAEIGDTAIYMI